MEPYPMRSIFFRNTKLEVRELSNMFQTGNLFGLQSLGKLQKEAPAHVQKSEMGVIMTSIYDFWTCGSASF